MADAALRVEQPILLIGAVTLDDPRSFSITMVARRSFGPAGRPGDTYDTTHRVFGYGFDFSFTAGDENNANILSTTATYKAELTIVLTSVKSHGDTNIVYTCSNALIRTFPPMGGGFGEARVFNYGGSLRSADGSTSPLAVA